MFLDQLNNRMTPSKRLQSIKDKRLGIDNDEFTDMKDLAATQLIEKGASPRIAAWFKKQIGKMSTEIFKGLTKRGNKEVFDKEDLDALFDLEIGWFEKIIFRKASSRKPVDKSR